MDLTNFKKDSFVRFFTFGFFVIKMCLPNVVTKHVQKPSMSHMALMPVFSRHIPFRVVHDIKTKAGPYVR